MLPHFVALPTFLLSSCQITLKYLSQQLLKSMNLTAYMGSFGRTRCVNIFVDNGGFIPLVSVICMLWCLFMLLNFSAQICFLLLLIIWIEIFFFLEGVEGKSFGLFGDISLVVSALQRERELIITVCVLYPIS